MQLQIPKAPRQVKLSQVPGAYARLAVVGAGAAAGSALFLFVGLRVAAGFGAEAGFYERAVETPAKVQAVALPKFDERTSQPAKLTVLYTFADQAKSASGVLADAERAEGLGLGADVTLLVDPHDADHPRELQHATALRFKRFGREVVGVGILLGLLLVALGVRNVVRGELAPLKNGMLVWLTCDGALPDTRAETVFPAHYFQQDVKHAVRARARPGRAPVKNGDKVLAAVVPSRPTWVRVIDEDLARTLGWFA